MCIRDRQKSSNFKNYFSKHPCFSSSFKPPYFNCERKHTFQTCIRMELFRWSYIFLFAFKIFLEKNRIKNQRFSRFPYRTFKFCDAVEVLPSSLSQKMFSTAFFRFLPFKLEPLGFSLNGQLRVAS